MQGQIIYTNTARCRDCYRCLRVCPVNAIKVKDGQASVDGEKCIQCGTCIRECPQKAKTYRNDIEKVKSLIRDNAEVAVSIAPTFISLYNEWEVKRIPSLFRRLGFSYVSFTSYGAYYVAEKTKELLHQSYDSLFASACPAFINYIEKYKNDKIKNLANVVSPMIAHSKILHEKLGKQTKVVFVGPCIAKKGEAERKEYYGDIDAVITFDELFEWIEKEGINLNALEESLPDDLPKGFSGYFPLPGGLLKTASLSTDLFSENLISVSGIEEIIEIIDEKYIDSGDYFIEPLICKSGCINGPGLKCGLSLNERKKNLYKNSMFLSERGENEEIISLDFKTSFSNNLQIPEITFSEAEINSGLEETGKGRIEDQLNCGACGYKSCREKVIANLQGMAEVEMCLPYMRKKAEQRTDKIIESTPNGIIIINDKLEIIHVNPAFKRMFMCNNAVIGKSVSYLIDPEPFIQLRKSLEDKSETVTRYENYNLDCQTILYKMPDVNQYVGIFIDITKHLADNEKLDEMKKQTIMQAQQLIEHQVEMAQRIAKFLGESTAKSEELVENILKLSEDPKKVKGNGKNWLWDIYTSKQ